MSGDAKQQSVRLAWIAIVGEDNYHKLNHDENGFSSWRCRNLFPRHLDDLIYSRLKRGHKTNSGEDLEYRPRSLDGLEKNNGWNKLPTTDILLDGWYWILVKHPKTLIENTFPIQIKNGDGKIPFVFATHYQMIKFPSQPFY